MRLIYLLGGWISLALGFVGAFLPLIPTTPFVLLAAFCFARSSSTLYGWLLNHQVFGHLVYNWQHYGAISFRAKVSATVMMSAMVGASVLLSKPSILAACVVLGICAVVLLFIWSRPSSMVAIEPDAY